MKKDKISELSYELRFLNEEERKKELDKYSKKMSDSNVSDIAKEIYEKRGIVYDKLSGNILNKFIEEISILVNDFKVNDRNTRVKMIIEIIYIIVLLILIKIPFDLVRDIGYEYLSIITANNIINIIYRLVFLILYTITLVCVFIVLARNFNAKYNKKKSE